MASNYDFYAYGVHSVFQSLYQEVGMIIRILTCRKYVPMRKHGVTSTPRAIHILRH